jgi:hypothetical protein
MAQIHLKSPRSLLAASNDTQVKKYPDASDIKTLYRISRDTGADIIQQKSVIEIWGYRSSIKKAFTQVVQLDWVKKNLKQTKFQVELAETHRDFINGKKNGKLNKIMNTSGCKLELSDAYNGFNFLIDIYQGPEAGLQGLELLEVGIFPLLLSIK